MAKIKQFEKVLELIQSGNGDVVSKESILDSLKSDIAANRIATYIWEIKTKANVPIETVKNGRVVVGYKLPASDVKLPSMEEVSSDVVTDSEEEIVADVTAEVNSN